MTLGEKIVLTEFIAYSNLSELRSADGASWCTAIIASYVLFSFSNFVIISVQIGSIGGLP